MQALYRKYRPTIFGEVEGQEHIVRTLQGALSSGRIGHAYLFCGPRGTGKTTMARLLAKVLNCTDRDEEKSGEPCHSCSSCLEIHEGRSLDLIEIDAASNRGIDEIRNLKDSAMVAATSSKYKVFIIDEVHMLTPPAFNALLKILEEPPSHVIFILATTEPHKILETILSRVQRFDFKKITTQKIVDKLKRIAKSEKVTIEEPALLSVASVSSGSLRDAESAFSKLIAYTGNEITADDAAEVLGIVPLQAHDNLLKLVQHKKTKEAITQISDLYESGVDLDNFLKQFVKYLRVSLMNAINQPSQAPAGQATAAASGFDLNEAEFLIKAINLFVKAGNELRFSPIPQLPIELAILELTK